LIIVDGVTPTIAKPTYITTGGMGLSAHQTDRHEQSLEP